MSLKTIQEAGLGKRVGAFILDLLVTVVGMFTLFLTLGQNVIMPAFDYDGNTDLMFKFREDAGLISVGWTEEGHYASADYLEFDDIIFDEGENVVGYGYEKYAKVVWDYYTVFLPTTTEYQIDAVDGVAPSAYYTKEYCKEKIFGIGANPASLYFSDISDDGVPTLTALIQATMDTDAAGTSTTLKELFINAEHDEGIYIDAILHSNAQSVFQEAKAKCNQAVYFASIPAVVIPPLVFFFIIPLILKEGKTLFKLLLKTSVIGKDGYKTNRFRIGAHYIVILLIFELLLIPDQLIGLLIMLLALVVDFMVMAMSSDKRSLHDKIAGTMVIDSKKSYYFASVAEEEKYAEDNPNSLVAKELGLAAKKEKQIVRRSVLSDADVEAMNSILDLSTIDARRKEAREMTSFDDFENGIDSSKK